MADISDALAHIVNVEGKKKAPAALLTGLDLVGGAGFEPATPAV